MEFDDFCHGHNPPIPFIRGEVCGLFGSIFCDFGSEFTISIISFKSNENSVKKQKVLSFKPLREALKDPGLLLRDFSKSDRPPLLHLVFQALDKFIKQNGRYPCCESGEDVERLIDFANQLSGDYALLNKDSHRKLLRLFSNGSEVVLGPMASMFGTIIAEEAIKACTSKFHPIMQFFYFDLIESLPACLFDDVRHPNDWRPMGTRYDSQMSIFGSCQQQKFGSAKVFIVGSGALGCEFMKNLALMGVCCGEEGKLFITDDDVIEENNLSTQFLFRAKDIGQPKSIVAASAASSMNPQIHVEARTYHAGRETEHVFNDEFWENLTVVISAVDNIDTRLYLDEMCVYHKKPLLEAGTLGTMCSTQTVIPFETENYGASRDPVEMKPSISTLELFPYHINHCLTWARSEFEWFFDKVPREVNSYLSNPDHLFDGLRFEDSEQRLMFKDSQQRLMFKDSEQRKKVEDVCGSLVKDRCVDIFDCILWARRRFEDYFVKRVERCTWLHPENEIMYNTRVPRPLWSAPRRFPHPVRFSIGEPSHIQFLMAASTLRAKTFRIDVPDWALCPESLANAIKSMTDSVPSHLVDDSDAAKVKGVKVELIRKLETCRWNLPDKFKMQAVGFEKDNDNHIDFISVLANLRARTYHIPEIDRLSAKIFIEGIIPGNASGKALAASFACLELYKVLDGLHLRHQYRNSFVNMGTPLFTTAEPLPPKRYENRLMSWTRWHQKFPKFDPPIMEPTLRDLLEWLHKNKVAVGRISHRGRFIYRSFHHQKFYLGGACENPGMMPPWVANLLDRRLDDIVGLPWFNLEVDCIDLLEDDSVTEEVQYMVMPEFSFYFKAKADSAPAAAATTAATTAAATIVFAANDADAAEAAELD